MMTLPSFTDPNPTVKSLWDEQNRLKSQADRMIQETGVFELYSKYGELSPIGGSYQYNLMVYPDLDIALVAKIWNKEAFADLVRDSAASSYVRKVSTADCVNFAAVQKGRPKGYWIGLEIPFEGDRWGIDCWLQQPEWQSSDEDTYATRLGSLEQSGRDAILRIKYDLIRRGVYGKMVFSSDVYDAVLDKGVRSLDEFNALITRS